jgi:molybdate transport system substrate-binding protein
VRRLGAGVAVLALLIAPASCGSDGAKPSLTVFAAASLKRAFTRYAARLTSVRTRLSFAGSDELAAQIRQGIRPDAFAAADTALPAALHAGRLVGAPTVFAANRLALAVPAQSTKVRTLADLSDRGVTIAIGSPSVPVGSYTRSVLGKLSGDQSRTILSHVRSNEPDVAGVVGKLSRGAVDAGFVYVTDVRASGGRLRAIELPPPLRPRVAYGIAVVQGSSHEKQARAFIAGLLSGEGRRVLRDAGFEPPPP